MESSRLEVNQGRALDTKPAAEDVLRWRQRRQ